MDVLLVRKIGHPHQHELAVGAVCEDDEPIWNQEILAHSGLEPKDLQDTLKAERKRIKQQADLFRNGRGLRPVEGRIALVVDDGLATGATVTAAIKSLRKMGVAQVIVAIPVGAASSAIRISDDVDTMVVLEQPEELYAVGQWYEDFSQVSDREVTDLLNASHEERHSPFELRELQIPVGHAKINGDLTTLPSMKALIVFAHGSGSSRKSPRNQMVASYLHNAGYGTLLFDLLTEEEAENRVNVFDIELLSHRLSSVTRWVHQQPELRNLLVGYFGASTGAGDAIQAAAVLSTQFSTSNQVFAIASRGGRPDLAGHYLQKVTTPTLLIVGGRDSNVLEINQQAKKLLVNSKLSVIPKATHLFEEPGALEEVSRLAVLWFDENLDGSTMTSIQSKEMTLDEAIEKSMINVRTEDDLLCEANNFSTPY